MKRKILLGAIIILLIIIGQTSVESIEILDFIISPYSLVGDFLRNISLASGFGNIISILLFWIITLSPLGYLVFKFKKKTDSILDFIFIPVLSILLGFTLYQFINPHILLENANPLLVNNIGISEIEILKTIILTGVSYIGYLVFFIYLLLKYYLSDKSGSLKLFLVLTDFVIIIYLISFFGVELSLVSSKYNELLSSYDITQIYLSLLGSFISVVLTIYLLNLFRGLITEIDKDGFNESLLKNVIRLHKISFILLVTVLSVMIIDNIYQLMFMSELSNVYFKLNLPIGVLLISVLIFIISKYVTKVNQLDKEHSLII